MIIEKKETNEESSVNVSTDCLEMIVILKFLKFKNEDSQDRKTEHVESEEVKTFSGMGKREVEK